MPTLVEKKNIVPFVSYFIKTTINNKMGDSNKRIKEQKNISTNLFIY